MSNLELKDFAVNDTVQWDEKEARSNQDLESWPNLKANGSIGVVRKIDEAFVFLKGESFGFYPWRFKKVDLGDGLENWE